MTYRTYSFYEASKEERMGIKQDAKVQLQQKQLHKFVLSCDKIAKQHFNDNKNRYIFADS